MKTHEIEQKIAKQIITDAIAAGYLISVDDGGEVVIKRSRNKAEIVAAMFSTDSDTLTIRKADGTRVGAIFLVYGNGADVISDYTDNSEIQRLLTRPLATSDQMSATA